MNFYKLNGRPTGLFKRGVLPFFINYFLHYDFPQEKPQDPKTDLFIIENNTNVEPILPYLDRGFKCIIIDIWEDRLTDYPLLEDYKKNVIGIVGCNSIQKFTGIGSIINVPSWFWIHEYFWIETVSMASGFQPNHINDKLFLMPLGKSRNPREYIYKATEKYHADSFVSFLEKGISLPGHKGPIHNLGAQREMEEDWYNRTLFSLVVETHPMLDQWSSLFITEKTFKPIAFFHPFVTFNKPGALQWVKDQGFETYDNVFDESYDTEPDDTKRMLAVLDNIHKFEYDDLTLQKMTHNHNHFFTYNEIVKRAENEIVNPIRNFLESD